MRNVSHILLIFLAFTGISVKAAPELDPCGRDGRGLHGHVVYGSQRIFIEHLPMFHNQHAYQVISEAEIGRATNSVTGASVANGGDVYRAALADENRYFTMDPAPFDLPLTLCARGKTFAAKFMAGHFERPATNQVPYLENAEVTVTKTIHFRKFRDADQRPAEAEYIVVGGGEEVFLSHRVVRSPDFLQVVRIQISPAPAAAVEGEIVRIDGVAESGAREGLVQGREYTAKTRAGAVAFRFVVAEEIFKELGDLE